MAFRFAADGVLLLHLAFIVFALLGGVLALWWRRILWLHAPAAAWGFYVELSARVCPLTDMENHLRILAGQSGYSDSFIEHYLLDIVYPGGLTREIQFALAGVVLLVNLAIYGWLYARWRRGGKRNA